MKEKGLCYHKRLSWEIYSCDGRIIDAIRASPDNKNEMDVNNQKCRLTSYEESFHTYKIGTVTVRMDTPMLHYITDRETGYYGIYKITASPGIMNYIYYAGLGAKNSMGFGTIKEDYTGRN